MTEASAISAPSASSRFRILVIPGDGIGPEVTSAATSVLSATGLRLEFVEAEAGWGTFQRSGVALPETTLQAARQADAILFGAVASPSQPVAGYKSPIVALRRALDLYANLRPIYDLRLTINNSNSQLPPQIANPKSKIVNLVVVRENTEGLYAGRERVEDNGNTAIAERVITRRASERIARAAFELARARDQGSGVKDLENMPSRPLAPDPRPLVTIVHKANVLRETCGLFRTVVFGVAKEFPDVQVDELLVDTAALQLVERPERFDVIVTTNLFGDILSDVACHWGGGMGMATSANLGETHALFEPVHGAAPDIAGKGIANPLAAIGCAAMLLEWHALRAVDGEQWTAEAKRIRAAVQHVLIEGPRTPDLGGNAHTEDVTNAVIAAMSGRKIT